MSEAHAKAIQRIRYQAAQHVICLEDGSFYYDRSGCHSAWELRVIADLLDELTQRNLGKRAETISTQENNHGIS